MTTPPDSWHHIPDNPYNPHAWILGDPTVGEGCWMETSLMLVPERSC